MKRFCLTSSSYSVKTNKYYDRCVVWSVCYQDEETLTLTKRIGLSSRIYRYGIGEVYWHIGNGLGFGEYWWNFGNGRHRLKQSSAIVLCDIICYDIHRLVFCRLYERYQGRQRHEGKEIGIRRIETRGSPAFVLRRRRNCSHLSSWPKLPRPRQSSHTCSCPYIEHAISYM